MRLAGPGAGSPVCSAAPGAPSVASSSDRGTRCSKNARSRSSANSPRPTSPRSLRTSRMPIAPRTSSSWLRHADIRLTMRRTDHLGSRESSASTQPLPSWHDRQTRHPMAIRSGTSRMAASAPSKIVLGRCSARAMPPDASRVSWSRMPASTSARWVSRTARVTDVESPEPSAQVPRQPQDRWIASTSARASSTIRAGARGEASTSTMTITSGLAARSWVTLSDSPGPSAISSTAAQRVRDSAGRKMLSGSMVSRASSFPSGPKQSSLTLTTT